MNENHMTCQYHVFTAALNSSPN